MKKNIKFTWLILTVFLFTVSFGFSQPAAYAATDLSDINGHWAQSQIEDLTARDIIAGYPDKTFKPDQTITRAEFTVILVKAFELEGANGENFSDTANHWAKNDIAIASSAGIISGYGKGLFGPDDLITREQMAVMVVNAAKLDPSAESNNFIDKDMISEWAKNSVAIASSNNIIAGYPDNSFKPQQKSTRAEAVVVIDKSMKVTAPGAAITGLGILQMGETTTATAKTTEAGAAGWTSSDPTVAKVDAETGEVTALAAGKTTISYTGSTSGKVNSIVITVYPEATVKNPSIGAVQVGAAVTPTEFTAPGEGENIIWTSSDTEVATIDEETGEITALAAGDTTIAYKVVNKDTGHIVAKGSLEITVLAAAEKGAEITGLGVLQLGETTAATAETTEVGAAGWTSSDPTVATVDEETGVVAALAAGATTISYTGSTSGKVNSIVITVYPEATVKNPSIEAVQVGAAVTPTEFTEPGEGENIIWTSSNTEVATIDEETGEITALAAGDTTIAYKVVNKDTGLIVAKGSLTITVD